MGLNWLKFNKLWDKSWPRLWLWFKTHSQTQVKVLFLNPPFALIHQAHSSQLKKDSTQFKKTGFFKNTRGLGQLEALCVEAVSFFAGNSAEQGLLLLHTAGGLQLVHGGQIEEHALVQVVLGVLLHHGLQLPQGVLELALVEQTHRCIVVGLQEKKDTRLQRQPADCSCVEVDTPPPPLCLLPCFVHTLCGSVMAQVMGFQGRPYGPFPD